LTAFTEPEDERDYDVGAEGTPLTTIALYNYIHLTNDLTDHFLRIVIS
jgi:hypothetical protein